MFTFKPRLSRSKMRRAGLVRAAAVSAGVLACSQFACAQPAPAPAQSPAPQGSGGSSAAPQVPAPAMPPAPAEPPAAPGSATASVAAGPGAKTFSLADIVNLAINTNYSVTLARQKLAQANELIPELNAQGKPQTRVDAADLYTSYPTTGVGIANPAIENPILPTGNTIPGVTDLAMEVGTSYVGNSYLNVPVSNGAGSSGVVGSAPSSYGLPGAGATPGIGASPTSPAVGGVTSPGATSPSPAPGGAGGSSAPSGTGSSGGTSSSSDIRRSEGPAIALGALPPIISQYATAESDASSMRLANPASSQVASRPPAATPAAAARMVSLAPGAGQQADQSTGSTSSSGASSSPLPYQKNNFGARFAVSQYVDVFGLLNTGRDVEKITRDFYALDVERIQNEVALTAKNLYFNVLLMQANVDVQREQLAYATENVRVVQARVNQRIASEFDLLTAQTLYDNDLQAEDVAANQLALARANLAYLLGIDPATIGPLVSPALPSTFAPIDLAQSVQTAYVRRPEMVQADNDVTIANRLVKLAAAPLKPTFGFVGTAGYMNESADTNTSTDYTIGVELGIPLDDGGATRASVRAAKDELATQETNRDQLRMSVQLEVRQAVLNIENAQLQLRTSQTSATLAEEAVRLANVRYQAGVGTLLDVTNALAQLATARTNVANAEFQYQASLASYLRALGGR